MKKIIGSLGILLSVVLFSCNNDKVDLLQDNAALEKSAQITLSELNLEAVATASEYEVEFYGNAEEMLTRWGKMGKKWNWTGKLRYMTNHCPDVSIVEGENDGYPRIVTLNYGDGTILKNEKVLSGTIVIEISGPRSSASFTRMVTYQNFTVDSIQIAGTSLIEINRENETFRNNTSDLTFTINGESVVTRSSNRTWTWVAGMETTEDQTDDVIHIEGVVDATSGTDSYKKEIIEPLVRLGDCRYIVSGTVKVTLNGDLISTLNYGDGECDEVATFTNSDGETVEVDLANCKMKGNQGQNKNNKKGQGKGQNGNGNGGGNGKG